MLSRDPRGSRLNLATLVQLPYSPWSLKARWALRHHGIDVQLKHYLPVIGAPILRLKARPSDKHMSVPVLLSSEGAIWGSFAIAQWADAHGTGTPLIPDSRLADISAWDARCEALMEAGRALLIHALQANTKAKRESLPGVFPSWSRRWCVPIADKVLGNLDRKYMCSRVSDDAWRGLATRMALKMQSALADRDLLFDQISLADVTIALSLQFIDPLPDRYVALGTATRSCWRQAQIADQVPQLRAWRDRFVERYWMSA